MRITRSQMAKFACVVPPRAAPVLTPALRGFYLTPEQQHTLIQSRVYTRLDEFIHTYCQKQELADWMSRNRSARPLWNGLWPKVCVLREQDRALALLLAVVCACEGIALPHEDQLIAQLSVQETRIKRFMEERGYFQIAAFECIGQPATLAGALA